MESLDFFRSSWNSYRDLCEKIAKSAQAITPPSAASDFVTRCVENAPFTNNPELIRYVIAFSPTATETIANDCRPSDLGHENAAGYLSTVAFHLMCEDVNREMKA